MVKIYECLCEMTRLRILCLLTRGPLCVCHLQEVLGASQVKISKHLGYLRARGLVQGSRHGNWVVYALASPAPRELEINLACLQDWVRENEIIRRDLARLRRVAACAAPGVRRARTGSANRRVVIYGEK